MRNAGHSKIAYDTHQQEDQVSNYGYILMESDTMQYYLRHVEMIPRERSNGAFWMGDYWATCLLRDTTRILILSHYGGFFADFVTGQYYELPLELRAAWHDYLNSKYLSLLREKDNKTQSSSVKLYER